MEKRRYRLLFAAILVLLLASIGGKALAYSETAETVAPGSDAWRDQQAVDPRPGITVLATQDAGRGVLEEAELIAFAPNGSVLYYNNTYNTYFDVDHVPGTRATVDYVATDYVRNQSRCGLESYTYQVGCADNYLVRTNLSTGESEVLHHRVRRMRWHDADRINETHYVVAGIQDDAVFIVDVETGIIEWRWEAQNHFDLSSGGEYPGDWTHLNDVEYLRDGRIMVSMKEHDQVVFVDQSTGVIDELTLGSDDDHETLYEQHNPDYIPETRGGPAVLVSDSENNRIVEYQREGDAWRESWVYQRPGMNWPRDADRLPNGHTLVTDSNGNRVFEINQSGGVVWEYNTKTPYEAERLPGDESTGPSASLLGLESQTVAESSGGSEDGRSRGTATRAKILVKSFIPNSLYNSIAFLVPAWFEFWQGIAGLGILGTLGLWIGLELKSLPYRPRLHRPVTVHRTDRDDD
jgi:hypothetical protein